MVAERQPFARLSDAQRCVCQQFPGQENIVKMIGTVEVSIEEKGWCRFVSLRFTGHMVIDADQIEIGQSVDQRGVGNLAVFAVELPVAVEITGDKTRSVRLEIAEILVECFVHQPNISKRSGWRACPGVEDGEVGRRQIVAVETRGDDRKRLRRVDRDVSENKRPDPSMRIFSDPVAPRRARVADVTFRAFLQQHDVWFERCQKRQLGCSPPLQFQEIIRIWTP